MDEIQKVWLLLTQEEDEALSRHMGSLSTAQIKAVWSYANDLQDWARGFLKARNETIPLRATFGADSEADRA